MAAWGANFGRRVGVRHEGTLRTVRGTENAQSVLLVVVVVEGRLCLLQEVGVAVLHVLKVGEGARSLAVTGLG